MQLPLGAVLALAIGLVRSGRLRRSLVELKFWCLDTCIHLPHDIALVDFYQLLSV
jgi:hypothetical protein